MKLFSLIKARGRQASEPHVSISLTAFNEGPFVSKTVQALLLYTDYPSFDILLHDDGSTDGSCDNLPKDSRVKVIRSESRHGVAEGRRIAVEACHGPLLLTMDCHVAPREPQWLKWLVYGLQKYDFQAVISPISVPLDAETWRLKLEKPRVLTRLQKTFQVSWWKVAKKSDPLVEVSALRGIAKLMTWDVYEALGGFDGALVYGGEEADLSVRAWMAGFSCVYVPASLIGHVFKSRSQFPRSFVEDTVSRLRVAYKCLSREKYNKVLQHNRAFLNDAGGWGPRVFNEAAALVAERQEEFELARQEVQSRSIRSGEWFLDKFAIDL